MFLAILVLAAAAGRAHASDLRPTLEVMLNDLTTHLLMYLENHDREAMTRVSRDVSGISALLDQYKGGPLVDQRWREFSDMTMKLMANSWREVNDNIQLTRLQEQARMSFQQPASLVLLDNMAVQHEKIQSAERAKAAFLRNFIKSRQDLNRLLAQPLSESIPAASADPVIPPPTQAPLPVPGPLGTGFLILMSLVIACSAAIREIMSRRMSAPAQKLLRAAESAAAGDLSWRMNFESESVLGRLGHAIERLILVLARSENLVYQLSALVDSSTEAIISQNRDGAIVSWNKGAQRIYGYSAKEAKGNSIRTLIPQRGGEQLAMMLEQVKAGETAAPAEMIQQGRSGRQVHVFLKIAGVFDSTRQMIGISLWAQDFTDAPRLAPRLAPPQESNDIPRQRAA